MHVRCYAFTGPYLSLDTSFAVGNFVADIISGKQIKLSGDGSQLRSYLYAADVVVWMFTILGNGEPTQSYNVGGNQTISIKDLASSIKMLADGIVPKIKEDYESDNKYLCSTKIIIDSFNVKEQNYLMQGLQKTIDWNLNKL